MKEDPEENRKANKKSLEQETMRLGIIIPVNKKSLMSSSSMEDRMEKTAASYVSKMTEQKNQLEKQNPRVNSNDTRNRVSENQYNEEENKESKSKSDHNTISSSQN